MLSWSREMARAFFLFVLFPLVPSLHSTPLISFSGVLRDSGGNPAGMATVKLIAVDSRKEYSTTTSATGAFAFTEIAGSYTITVNADGKIWTAAAPVILKEGATLTAEVRLPAEGHELRVTLAQNAASPQASGRGRGTSSAPDHAAPRAVHRQRGHDRRRRLLRGPARGQRRPLPKLVTLI